MSKLSKKELRSPDQVWQASAQTFSWLRANWVVASIVVVVGFFLLVSTLYIKQVRMRAEAEAQASYGEVAALFEQWQLSDEGTKSEIRSSLDAALSKLAENYPDSDANRLASLYRARLKIAEAKAEESLVDLNHYLKALPKSQRALALYPMATVHEDLGRLEDAIQNYNSILGATQDVEMKKWALLGKARVQQKLNQSAEARSTYDEFLNEFPSAPEARMVRGLRARTGN